MSERCRYGDHECEPARVALGDGHDALYIVKHALHHEAITKMLNALILEQRKVKALRDAIDGEPVVVGTIRHKDVELVRSTLLRAFDRVAGSK